MSITINGATNTLTAASGLTIAGNTAVTGTLSATGVITKTNTAATLSNFFSTTGSTTEGAYARASNTSGTLQWGIEGAAGGGTLTGASAYSGFIGTVTNTDFHIQRNNTVVGTFSSTGLAVTGTLSSTDHASFGGGARYDSEFLTVRSAVIGSYFQNTAGNGNPAIGLLAYDNGAAGVIRPAYVGGYGVKWDGNDFSSLSVNNTEIARATSTGLAVTGLLDLSAASSGQIKFPATQNASADANTLDDYEEGTWTPSVGGTATYTTQTGTYTKIGRVVTVYFDLQINAIGTGSTTVISGLPFTEPLISAGAIGYFSNAANTFVSVSCYATGTTVTLTSLTTAAATSTSTAVLGNGTRVLGSATYVV